jgi:hypothetical protein
LRRNPVRLRSNTQKPIPSVAAVTGKTGFKRKARSSMRRMQRDPGEIRSLFQKNTLKYAA